MSTALETRTPHAPTIEPRSLIWVLDEHLDFAHDLCALEALILSRGHEDHPSLRRELASWVSSVLPRLEAHAAHEERSALYTTLPLQHPIFAPTIVRLRAEHRTIVEGLRAVLGDVEKARLSVLLSELAALVRIMRRHEADEDDILLEAYFAETEEE